MDQWDRFLVRLDGAIHLTRLQQETACADELAALAGAIKISDPRLLSISVLLPRLDLAQARLRKV